MSLTDLQDRLEVLEAKDAEMLKAQARTVKRYLPLLSFRQLVDLQFILNDMVRAGKEVA